VRADRSHSIIRCTPLVSVGFTARGFALLGHLQVIDTSADQDGARFDHHNGSPFGAEADGFSVHAGVSIRAGDAQGREQLLRYCARPTLSLERLSVLRDGRIAYRSKYPRRGGKTHRVRHPMEFMARIAALIPPPRHALVRYSGVLAPASKWRRMVVPAAPEKPCEHEQPQRDAAAAPTAKPAHPSGPALPSTRSVNRFAQVDNTKPPRSGFDKFRGRRSTPYIDWATLMKRSMGQQSDCTRRQAERWGARHRRASCPVGGHAAIYKKAARRSDISWVQDWQ